jgi:hypothetical protein
MGNRVVDRQRGAGEWLREGDRRRSHRRLDQPGRLLPMKHVRAEAEDGQRDAGEFQRAFKGAVADGEVGCRRARAIGEVVIQLFGIEDQQHLCVPGQCPRKEEGVFLEVRGDHHDALDLGHALLDVRAGGEAAPMNGRRGHRRDSPPSG